MFFLFVVEEVKKRPSNNILDNSDQGLFHPVTCSLVFD